ncbi:protein of unknown function [Candidatus Nitrotoga arctica]|uniref:Uncharacterized protein n=1 Tax=Candidatus Nitrotoga arctica TaxID=453162 RepID=A0ABM8YVQ2_9PROT|nr:protein of unknown function [Candidatus Nitrotoga arctica]
MCETRSIFAWHVDLHQYNMAESFVLLIGHIQHCMTTLSEEWVALDWGGQ